MLGIYLLHALKKLRTQVERSSYHNENGYVDNNRYRTSGKTAMELVKRPPSGGKAHECLDKQAHCAPLISAGVDAYRSYFRPYSIHTHHGRYADRCKQIRRFLNERRVP